MNDFPVLQDLSVLEKIERYRIALTPEYEGQWHADLYGDVEVPICSATGASVVDVVLMIVDLYEGYKGQWNIEDD